MRGYEYRLTLPDEIAAIERRAAVEYLQERGVNLIEWNASTISALELDASVFRNLLPAGGVNYWKPSIYPLPEPLFGNRSIELFRSGPPYEYVERFIYKKPIMIGVHPTAAEFIAEVESPLQITVGGLRRNPHAARTDAIESVVSIFTGPDLPPTAVSSQQLEAARRDRKQRQLPVLREGLTMLSEVCRVLGDEAPITLSEDICKVIIHAVRNGGAHNNTSRD